MNGNLLLWNIFDFQMYFDPFNYFLLKHINTTLYRVHVPRRLQHVFSIHCTQNIMDCCLQSQQMNRMNFRIAGMRAFFPPTFSFQPAFAYHDFSRFFVIPYSPLAKEVVNI